MERFALVAGRALRRARNDLGLTLRDVQRVSGGRFKPSSVAGHERGERAISLERFCELAGFYGIPGDRLLAEILKQISPDGRRELVIDLNRLSLVPGEEGSRVAEFVSRVREERGDRQSDVITLRNSDLEALALASHIKPRALMVKLRPALRETPPAG